MKNNTPESKITGIRSIKWRLMIVMASLMAILVIILTYTQISSQKEMLENELNKRIRLLKENLIERGKSLIRDLSLQVENDIASFNFSGAMEAVRNRVGNNEEIKYAILMDSSGIVLTDTLRSEPFAKLTERDTKALNQKKIAVMEYKEGNESLIEIINPVQVGTEPWGVLRVIYTLKQLDREIENSELQIREEIRRLFYKSVATSIGFIGVCFVIVFILSARLLKPLILLTGLARKLSKGDFSVSSTIRIRSKDEVGVLAAAFIEMSMELKSSYEKLEEYNKTLEQRVRKRTEEIRKKNIRLGNAIWEVETAKKEAEKADQAKGDFLANMSHEIRTPMNAITNMTYLALNQNLPPKAMNYLNTVQTSAQSLLLLIDDILDFSKIEAGKLYLEFSDFQLHDTMDNISDMFGGKISEKGLELVISVSEDVPGALVGDPLRLGQVLINLVNNAIKFTDRGEVIVMVEMIEKYPDRTLLRFSVRDTGIGISPEKLSLLFTPFTQADSSTTRKFGGTGLGLAISKQLVIMMNGEIRAESTPDMGSTFRFTAAFGRQAGDKERKQMVPPDLRKAGILVADDNKASRDALQAILEKLEFEVTTAASGEEALEKLACENQYALAIIDQRMPGTDGIRVSEIIRENPKLEQLPIIMMVEFGKEEIMQRAEAAGVNVFLPKPVKQSLLFHAVMEAFGLENKEAYVNEETAVRRNGSVNKIKGVRVLLVEDNFINQEVATEILSVAGVTVDIANNGREAVDILLSPAVRDYHAVMMDIQMPEMDGFEATRIIRDAGCEIPVIAMTAHAIKGDREKCFDAGMDDYVPKPVEPNRLYSALERWTNMEIRNPEPEIRTGNGNPETELPNLPGIDIESVLERLQGNVKLFKNLLISFQKDYIDASREIRDSLEKGDTASAMHLAHTIKGLAGNLSANELQKAALAIESGIEHGHTENILKQLEDFDDALNLVLESAKHLEQRERGVISGTSDKKTEIGHTQLNSLLVGLADLLMDNNPKAEAYFDSLKPLLSGISAQEDIINLEDQIGRYDFKSAWNTLSGIAGMSGISLEGESQNEE
ncbi:response regulator [Desulfococcaceae bacterium HSG8]|nr:response regulator [Desulfococcaceae bacterium HSG8]